MRLLVTQHARRLSMRCAVQSNSVEHPNPVSGAALEGWRLLSIINAGPDEAGTGVCGRWATGSLSCVVADVVVVARPGRL